ncbi:MAG: ABC transporter substrate-binding protein [Candidatus Heimdallarchaeota archaeon]|nr:ABC transporter substrate-binding protein [Candidatus Heimdallarchaeota archaeon]
MGKKVILLLGILLVSTFITFQPRVTQGTEPCFTLVAKTYENSFGVDYFNLIKQQLSAICIDLEIVIESWSSYIKDLLLFHDFDLCYVDSVLSGNGPDFSYLYSENGNLNIFGYDAQWDWVDSLGTGRNEWYLQEGKKMFPPNSKERVEHYWGWENHLMENLCLLYPLFSPNNFIAYYSNLHGYKTNKTLYQNWGSLWWEGTHTGQKNINELVLYGGAVTPELDYFFNYDASGLSIFKALLDPIIWVDLDQTVWPHLAKSFTFLNDTTIEITTRDNIKWAADPDGNFTDEYFDARDIYFTLYCWQHISLDAQRWAWLSKMELLDSKTIRLYVDGNPLTTAIEPDPLILEKLNTLILPEHYLNQTQLGDGKTPDINHLAWEHYRELPFGTGLFALSKLEENAEIELTIRHDSWWVDPNTLDYQALKWSTRFGTFDDPIEKLRIVFYPSQYFALEQFEKGKIDFMDITSFPEKVSDYKINNAFTVEATPQDKFSFLCFNVREDRDFVGDKTVSEIDPTISKGLAIRKAICYALDKTELNEIVHGNTFESIDWPIPETMGIWCNPNIFRYNGPQLDKAKYLLYVAGVGFLDFSITGESGLGFSIYMLCTIWVLGVIVVVSRKRR